MTEYIAFDVHKHDTWAMVETRQGQVLKQGKIAHQPGARRGFLERQCSAGGSVAVETVGNWYGVVEEIEAAGFTALLVNARRARRMMDNSNKTDGLDNGKQQRQPRAQKRGSTAYCQPGRFHR